MIKKLINQFLALLGLQLLYRTPRHLRGGRLKNLYVQVGKFNVAMPSTSLLPDIFKANPGYSSELGRLVAVTARKYADLRVIDVGANVGDTVAIVKSVSDVPVLCIEGDEQCFRLLETNTKQFRGISIHKLFLGEKTESIRAGFEKQGWNTTIIPSRNDSPTMLSLKSLDDFLPTLGDLHSYRVLKIDTEGFDCRIIRGGLNYVRQVRPVIAFEYNRDNMRRIGENGIETLSTLRDIGYDVILFYDGQGRLILSTTLSNAPLINDLHEYANGKNGAIYHYDLCVFHHDDEDIALAFQEAERRRLIFAG